MVEDEAIRIDGRRQTSNMLDTRLIRDEQQGDPIAIADVTARAFAGADHSDHTEPVIVERLRGTGALAGSLVAIVDGTLVGHVVFSPVAIDGAIGVWFGLGPVSVDAGHQSRGIGSTLIRQVLDGLRSRAAAGCVVLGDPAYYRRFGFEQDGGLRYEGPPPDHFMRLALNDDQPPPSRVEYAPAFSE